MNEESRIGYGPLAQPWDGDTGHDGDSGGDRGSGRWMEWAKEAYHGE